jgi:phosphate transport system permease protein
MASTTLAGGPATRRRRVSTVTWRALTYLALVLIMAPAAWLLLGVLTRAWSHWQWSVLWTQLTPTGGGLRDQILGTLILMVGVFIIAGTIGVLAGIHLAEFTQPKKIGGRLSGPLRTASDILSGFPSIVLGYVGYVALVVGLHWGFSLASAFVILSIMVIPYIAKTTENSLRQVPTGYREGAAALGMSAGYGLRKVVLKSALPGIATGLLLALAIACGETAPLIYTAGFSNTLPHSLTHAQFPYLTYVVFTYYNDPSVQKHYISYDAALILVVIVLLLLVASRVVVARTQRHSESAPQGGRGFFTRFRSVTNVSSPTAPAGVTPEEDPGQEPDLGTFPSH